MYECSREPISERKPEKKKYWKIRDALMDMFKTVEGTRRSFLASEENNIKMAAVSHTAGEQQFPRRPWIFVLFWIQGSNLTQWPLSRWCDIVGDIEHISNLQRILLRQLFLRSCSEVKYSADHQFQKFCTICVMCSHRLPIGIFVYVKSGTGTRNKLRIIKK